MWDDLCQGALGALVVVDSGRLDDCHPAVDYFERAQLPFVVAVNSVRRPAPRTSWTRIRWRADGPRQVPVVAFDARNRISVRDTLLLLLDEALVKAYRAVL